MPGPARASQCSCSRGAGDEQQLAGVTRAERALVVAGVELLDPEAGPGEQVLDFEAEEVAHCDGMNPPLRAPVRMDDVIEQLGMRQLAGAVALDDAKAAGNPPPIRHGELRFGRRLAAYG